MTYSQRELEKRAHLYADSKNITICERLGYGNDGTVWATNRESAVKIGHLEETFYRELETYQRLAEHGILEIRGFAVPRLMDFEERVFAIEVGVVSPPYILDFGKVYLDTPPDYPPEALRDWEEERSELYGPEQWKTVQKILANLKMYGIYYYDAKPGNIEFARED